MPWISRIMEALLIEAFRGPLTRVSLGVRQVAGVWFHPAVWQMIGALLIVFAFYWFYMATRRRDRPT